MINAVYMLGIGLPFDLRVAMEKVWGVHAAEWHSFQSALKKFGSRHLFLNISTGEGKFSDMIIG